MTLEDMAVNMSRKILDNARAQNEHYDRCYHCGTETNKNLKLGEHKIDCPVLTAAMILTGQGEDIEP